MTNRPVKEFKMGKIKASVWSNTGEKGAWHSVTVSRLYKDNDKWKSAESFNREDLPVLCKVLNLAHSWLYEQSAEERKARRGRENLERLSGEVKSAVTRKSSRPRVANA